MRRCRPHGCSCLKRGLRRDAGATRPAAHGGRVAGARGLVERPAVRQPARIAIHGRDTAQLSLKVLKVAAKDGGLYVELNLENVRNRTYPLADEVYFYFDHPAGKPVDPKIQEFLRYILSDEGQAEVGREGDYLRLPAGVAREQVRTLE